MTAVGVSLGHLHQPASADRPTTPGHGADIWNPVYRYARQQPQDTGPMHGRREIARAGGPNPAATNRSRRSLPIPTNTPHQDSTAEIDRRDLTTSAPPAAADLRPRICPTAATSPTAATFA